MRGRRKEENTCGGSTQSFTRSSSSRLQLLISYMAFFIIISSKSGLNWVSSTLIDPLPPPCFACWASCSPFQSRQHFWKEVNISERNRRSSRCIRECKQRSSGGGQEVRERVWWFVKTKRLWYTVSEVHQVNKLSLERRKSKAIVDVSIGEWSISKVTLAFSPLPSFFQRLLRRHTQGSNEWKYWKEDSLRTPFVR